MSNNYKINDSVIFDKIDESLANINIEQLMKVKLEMMKNGEDTSIIDKAISERKRRDELIKIKEKERIKRNRRIFLSSLLNGPSKDIIDPDLMPWENDSNYEKYNYEEEEMEEDDYYFDDDK